MVPFWSQVALVVVGVVALLATLAVCSILAARRLSSSSNSQIVWQRATLATCVTAYLFALASLAAPLFYAYLFPDRLTPPRVAADSMHALCFCVLFHKMCCKPNLAGLSLVTLDLYVAVFVTRYLDVLWNCHPGNMYNCTLKALYVAQAPASASCPPQPISYGEWS